MFSNPSFTWEDLVLPRRSLAQLREVYAAVARSESFTSAARQLRISQPALSRTVQEIERTLRVRLFDRTSRRVRITPAGEAFLEPAPEEGGGGQGEEEDHSTHGGGVPLLAVDLDELRGVALVRALQRPPLQDCYAFVVFDNQNRTWSVGTLIR